MALDCFRYRLPKGRLRQETHYYPFGLPMNGVGGAAIDLQPNRKKYQGNEWITDAGLDWMSFGIRQYDPQLARFINIDPLADVADQEGLSPYQAMGNNPVGNIDPYGLRIHNITAVGGNIQDESFLVAQNDELTRNTFWGRSWDLDPLNHADWSSGGWGGGNDTKSKVTNQGKAFGSVAEMVAYAAEHPGFTFSFEEGYLVVYGKFNPNATVLKTVYIVGYRGSGGFLSWNGPIARRIIPDKLSFSIGGDLMAFLGAGVQAVNFTILTRGKDPGVYLTPTFNVNAGYGVSVSGGFNFSRGNYTGDPRDISAEMLEGSSYGGIITGGYFGDIAVGVSYSNTKDGHGFINKNVGIGDGFGAFIGVQYQYTPGVGKIWGW